MLKKRPILDTNVIIRFLTNDSPQQADKVVKLLEEAGITSLEIPDVVIAEIIYVLLSFFKLNKEEVIEKIAQLIEFEKIKTNKKLIKKALEFYQNNSISFVDAYLCSLITNNKNSFIYSLDKVLQQVKGIKIQSP